MTGIYQGELRTELTHLRSGNKIITDAPPDNNGKGEAFSPNRLSMRSVIQLHDDPYGNFRPDAKALTSPGSVRRS